MAKGPFMEYLRQTVTQSGANAYTEHEIATPTSKTENMAMLIHSIEFSASRFVEAAPANGDAIQLQVTSTHQNSITEIADPDCIALYEVFVHLNAVFNTIFTHGAHHIKFDPPLLYPKAHLYLAVGSNGLAAAIAGQFRIGYTLEKVSREDFISALVE
ncbi:hypothetical protein ES708_28629 [subsurface metagenome]